MKNNNNFIVFLIIVIVFSCVYAHSEEDRDTLNYKVVMEQHAGIYANYIGCCNGKNVYLTTKKCAFGIAVVVIECSTMKIVMKYKLYDDYAGKIYLYDNDIVIVHLALSDYFGIADESKMSIEFIGYNGEPRVNEVVAKTTTCKRVSKSLILFEYPKNNKCCLYSLESRLPLCDIEGVNIFWSSDIIYKKDNKSVIPFYNIKTKEICKDVKKISFPACLALISMEEHILCYNGMSLDKAPEYKSMSDPGEVTICTLDGIIIGCFKHNGQVWPVCEKIIENRYYFTAYCANEKVSRLSYYDIKNHEFVVMMETGSRKRKIDAVCGGETICVLSDMSIQIIDAKSVEIVEQIYMKYEPEYIMKCPYGMGYIYKNNADGRHYVVTKDYESRKRIEEMFMK